MEKHHRVQMLDEALEAAVKLAHRYIPDRQLPDKAVSLLDTACARVAVSQHATPAQVEDCQRRIEALQTELEIIAREAAIGVDTAEREQRAKAALERALGAAATDCEAAWQREKVLVDEILAICARESRRRDGALSIARRGQRDERRSSAAPEELQARAGGSAGRQPAAFCPASTSRPWPPSCADWTGIPVGRMVKDEIATVLNLAQTLGQRVIGQDSRARDDRPPRCRPRAPASRIPTSRIGVFMLAGPSGVGKTETALALAEALYGGEQNLITINMSEFQEAHTVSTLKGAPPGYVGYGEGGVLTEAVRRKPYSVVLLDEVEKAHPDVHEIFFQVFDKGVMEDGEGRLIDFKNTLIILTTNVGTELIMSMCKDPQLLPDRGRHRESLARAAARRRFPRRCSAASSSFRTTR